MPSEIFTPYRHSGKFGAHGPALAVVAALAVGFPLGFAYAYLMKWIPFIILRVFGTAAYGLVFGFLVYGLMKSCKVRNNLAASLCGLGTGLAALYFAWNGHVHTLFKDAPLLCLPDAMLASMSYLFENGSWGLRGSGNTTGIPLAIVWAVEALFIVGFSTLLPYSMISDLPFCEKNYCWLDEEKKIDTLEAFTDSEQQAAFERGDLGPLLQAKPRTPNAPAFGRLTLKHSPRCDEFCTVRIENVTLKTDKNGDTAESKTELTRNLVLPKSMLALVTKFENFNLVAESLAKAA